MCAVEWGDEGRYASGLAGAADRDIREGPLSTLAQPTRGAVGVADDRSELIGCGLEREGGGEVVAALRVRITKAHPRDVGEGIERGAIDLDRRCAGHLSLDVAKRARERELDLSKREAPARALIGIAPNRR